MWERLDLQTLEFHTKILGKDMVQDVCCHGIACHQQVLEGLETHQKFVFREAVIFNGKTDKP